jgi:hypothetical protein
MNKLFVRRNTSFKKAVDVEHSIKADKRHQTKRRRQTIEVNALAMVSERFAFTPTTSLQDIILGAASLAEGQVGSPVSTKHPRPKPLRVRRGAG